MHEWLRRRTQWKSCGGSPTRIDASVYILSAAVVSHRIVKSAVTKVEPRHTARTRKRNRNEVVITLVPATATSSAERDTQCPVGVTKCWVRRYSYVMRERIYIGIARSSPDEPLW